MSAWTFDGFGNWTRGDREVIKLGPSLYQARLHRPCGRYDVIDETLYGTAAEAKAAADRLTDPDF